MYFRLDQWVADIDSHLQQKLATEPEPHAADCQARWYLAKDIAFYDRALGASLEAETPKETREVEISPENRELWKAFNLTAPSE